MRDTKMDVNQQRATDEELRVKFAKLDVGNKTIIFSLKTFRVISDYIFHLKKRDLPIPFSLKASGVLMSYLADAWDAADDKGAISFEIDKYEGEVPEALESEHVLFVNS
jgi:hypothetical protein